MSANFASDDYLHQVPSDRTSRIDDERISEIVPLPPPSHLIRFFPIQGTPIEALIEQTRHRVQQIVRGKSDRLLVVIGPCSIHDPVAAEEYATRLAEIRAMYQAELEIVMRVYFEKPRTTVGWKGLINDPYLDGTFRINEGLRIARDLLMRIHRLGVPAGSEFLDTISPQYIADMISWGAIGARTVESQVHRELASGLSAPIGFKNGTNGDIQTAIDAIVAAAHRHNFLSVHKNGQVAIVRTRGNTDCHLILRGGPAPNYDAPCIETASAALAAVGLPQRLMVDCSHANSCKQFLRQRDVAECVGQQIAEGDMRIIGVMLESYLEAGRQDLVPGQALVHGQSITDACLGWDDSAKVMHQLAEQVRRRRTQCVAKA